MLLDVSPSPVKCAYVVDELELRGKRPEQLTTPMVVEDPGGYDTTRIERHFATHRLAGTIQHMLRSENLTRGRLNTIAENASRLASDPKLSLPGGASSVRWRAVSSDAAGKANAMKPNPRPLNVRLKKVNFTKKSQSRRAVRRLWSVLNSGTNRRFVGDNLWPLAKDFNTVLRRNTQDAKGHSKVINLIIRPESHYHLNLATGQSEPLQGTGLKSADELFDYYKRKAQHFPNRDSFEVTRNGETVGYLAVGLHDKKKPNELEVQRWIGEEESGKGVGAEVFRQLDEQASKWYPNASVRLTFVEEHLGPSRESNRASGSTLREWSVDPVPYSWLLHRAQRDNTVEMNLTYAKDLPKNQATSKGMGKKLDWVMAILSERLAHIHIGN